MNTQEEEDAYSTFMKMSFVEEINEMFPSETTIRTSENFESGLNKYIKDTICRLSDNEFQPDSIINNIIDDPLNGVHKEFKIVKVYGGKNGNGKWSDYFLKLHYVTKQFDTESFNTWVVNWFVDAMDDVWTCLLAVEKIER